MVDDKKTEAEVSILKKPKGEVNISASFGIVSWGTDEDGKNFVKWDQEKWVPTDPRGRGREEKN